MTGKVEIHGHRGSRGTHPENSFPAFEEARDAGADYFEIDVHLSADREVVVFHDGVISARLCTDAKGAPVGEPRAIRELSWDEIREFEIGRVPQPLYPGQVARVGLTIPRLIDVLEWKTREAPGLRLNLEIKREPGTPWSEAEELTRICLILLARAGVLGETLVQSFDPEIVRFARRLEPALRLSCLFEGDADFAAIARDCGAQVAASHYPLVNPARVAQCRAAGIEVLPWTVNEPSEWERLIALGVSGIITDYPRRLRGVLGSGFSPRPGRSDG